MILLVANVSIAEYMTEDTFREIVSQLASVLRSGTDDESSQLTRTVVLV